MGKVVIMDHPLIQHKIGIQITERRYGIISRSSSLLWSGMRDSSGITGKNLICI